MHLSINILTFKFSFVEDRVPRFVAGIWDIRHHRHWQRALELVVGCRFSMLPSMIPKQGTILGGNMTLKGRNLTLACFHGMNFKAKSWALFTMHEPYIIFATESQQLPEGGKSMFMSLSPGV